MTEEEARVLEEAQKAKNRVNIAASIFQCFHEVTEQLFRATLKLLLNLKRILQKMKKKKRKMAKKKKMKKTKENCFLITAMDVILMIIVGFKHSKK